MSSDTSGMSGNAQAYTQAIYRIDGPPPVLLRIGQVSAALAQLHQHHGCASSVFITACNPRSRRLRPAANQRRLRALRRALDVLGRAYLPACGLDPQHLWPDEPSLWVPGLPLRQGLQLARRFGQNAIVWCRDPQPARLVWTYPPKARTRAEGRGTTSATPWGNPQCTRPSGRLY
ncbi:DUF3293 domain-containing protein [Castellaniella caeni]|uniref:DUF3293 domain-containing protein n=1 Tax=Castellaniella caeni TaxID=266123 RepID=UPI0011AFAF88|nr:DUF3293 domain-containing protein [Castellaniella caeni]